MVKKIALLVSILISLVGGWNFYKSYKNPSYAESFGSLTVNFHSSLPGNAVFDIHNFLPGDTITKSIDVKNEGNTSEVFVRGIKTDGSPGNPKLEDILDLIIKQGGTTVYSNKLATFLNLSKLSLGSLNKNQSKSFTFTVTFPVTAGNEYQNKLVKFNLEFSSAGDVKGDHNDHHNHSTPKPTKSPTPTPTLRPTPTVKPTKSPTPVPTKSPTPTPRHDNDHHNYWDDIKDFGDKCKSAIEEVFKFGKR